MRAPPFASLVVVPLTLLALSACVRRAPGVLYPSNRPITSPYTRMPPVQQDACQWFFLGLPVSRGATLRELVDRTRGSADAVVDLTVDVKLADYGLVARFCYLVAGTPVRIEAPGVAASADPVAPTPSGPTPSPVAAPAPAQVSTAWQPDDRRRVAPLAPTRRAPISVPGAPRGRICLVEVWTTATGVPEQVVPDASCDAKAATAAVAGVMAWTFEVVELEGQAVPVHFPLKVPVDGT